MPTREVTARASALRTDLLQQRYVYKDARGRPLETPRQMFARVARAVAAAEARDGASPSAINAVAKEFQGLMVRSEFLPNSPTLMNAGRENGMLSACFVLPVPDSIDGIFDAVRHAALVQKASGGTGFAFDSLRPTGDRVASSGGTTSGPISFMGVFAEASRAIQQGSFRRGANMGMMSVEHPDILEFITAKDQPGVFENFNLSIKVTDAFMKALKERPKNPHLVTNPRDGKGYFIPRNVEIRQYGVGDLLPAGAAKKPCYSVGEVWDLIVASAHATGEPGLCFIDRVSRDDPTPALGKIGATNPCGEQPLLPYESCNLGSINLEKFVLADGGGPDWNRLAETIRLAVRFLDNVIDVNWYPLQEIRDLTLANRKIGLGLMGIADALVMIGIRYNSKEAVDLADRLAGFLAEKAHDASQQLAESRGRFPNWAGSLWDTTHHRPMRNASCTTIAPTGSISIIAGCSSGIEPFFSIVTKRRALGREFLQVNPLVERLGIRQGWLDKWVRAALLDGQPPQEIRRFPRRLAELLVTSAEVSLEWHVKVQAAFQNHIDSAVSKTVNLRGDATVAEVDRTFRLAYELGCKGITVYRDDSQPNQTLSALPRGSGKVARTGLAPRQRPRSTTGQTYKFRMGCGTLFVTVNRDGQGPCEVFANLGKAGGCPSQSEATCRAVSAALRSGVEPTVLIEQLKGIRCFSTLAARQAGDGAEVLSCPDCFRVRSGDGR